MPWTLDDLIARQDVPPLEDWKTISTGGFFERRASDPGLMRIDEIVEEWHSESSGTTKIDTLYRLYMATDFYRRKFGKSGGTVSRLPAVNALYTAAYTKLTSALKVRSNRELDELLIQIYGKELYISYRGEDVKLGGDLAYFRTKGERALYKLIFRRGLANILTAPKASKGDDTNLVPFSSDAYDSHAGSGPGYAVFAMGTDGRIYVGNHVTGEFHHSSFLAGGTVLSAGEIKVSHGNVQEITQKSGHYQPGPQQMINILHRLRLYGVALSAVTVKTFQFDETRRLKMKHGHPDWLATKAPDYLARNGRV